MTAFRLLKLFRSRIHQPAQIGWKALRTMVSISDSTHLVSDPALWGKVSATFDNVNACQDSSCHAVVMTDDFTSTMLDASKWATYEIVREIQNGQLVSKVRNVNVNNRIVNRLALKNPELINEIQAKATLLEITPNGSHPFARIGGIFYNDTGDISSGYQGDIYAEVDLAGRINGPPRCHLVCYKI